MIRQERYHVFKRSVWCCARVQVFKGRGKVIFEDPDWQVVAKFAVLHSEGRSDEFNKWLALYDRALDRECKRLLRRLETRLEA